MRLYFAEPRGRDAATRVFDVELQGQPALRDFSVTSAAGGPRRSVVKEFHGVEVEDDLVVSLRRSAGSGDPPILCGMEMVAE